MRSSKFWENHWNAIIVQHDSKCTQSHWQKCCKQIWNFEWDCLYENRLCVMNVWPLFEFQIMKNFSENDSLHHIPLCKEFKYDPNVICYLSEEQPIRGRSIGCVKLCLLAFCFIIFQEIFFPFIQFVIRSFIPPLFRTVIDWKWKARMICTIFIHLVCLCAFLTLSFDTNQTNYVKMDAKCSWEESLELKIMQNVFNVEMHSLWKLEQENKPHVHTHTHIHNYKE